MITTRASVMRAAVWAALAILIVAVGVWVLLQPFPEISLAADEVLYIALMLAMIVSLALASLRTRGIERRFWTILLGATSLVFVGDAYFAWYTVAVDPRGPEMPAAFQVPQLMGAFLFLMIPVTLTQVAVRPFVTRLRVYVDLLVLICIGTGLAYILWTYHLFEGVAGANVASSLIAAVYPSYATVVLGLAAFVLFRPDVERQPPWELLVMFALIVYSLGMYLWPSWYAGLLASTGDAATVGGFVAAAGLGFYAIIMAVVYRLTDGSRAERLALRPIPSFLRRFGVAFAPLAILFVPGFGLYAYVVNRAGEEIEATIVSSVALALALLLVTRSWLGALELIQERSSVLTDPLTGVGTVTALRSRLDSSFVQAKRTGQSLGVATFDVDGFDRVNNVHGHDAGDDVLRQVAATVKAFGGPGSEVFRSGSDEFTIVMPSASLDDYRAVADRIARAVDRSVSVAGFPASVSGGVAVFPDHARDPDELLGAAWAALVAGSTVQSGSVTVFDPSTLAADDPEARLRQVRVQTQAAAVRAMASVLEGRDPNLRGHSENVAHLAERLGEVLGLDTDTIRRLSFAGHVHDVGKVALPDSVAARRVRPDEPDSELLARHSVSGERILASAGLADVARWVRSHHERWDGRGYPDGLVGEEIPLESRVLAVCDAFEVLTSGTPGRAVMSSDAALQELDHALGSRFDPRVAEAFIRMIGAMHIADAPALVKSATSSESA